MSRKQHVVRFNTTHCKGQDTRNRFQRMFDAKYNRKIYQPQQKNQTINRAEFNALLMRYGNTNLDRYTYLSRVGGHTKRHPRTRDLIQFQTEDIVNKSKLPRQAYNRRINQQIQQINASIDSQGNLKVSIDSIKPRKTSQWKSVWFTKHNRRK